MFFFQAEDGIRDDLVTGVQTCALPIYTARMAGAPHLDEIQRLVVGEVRGAEALDLIKVWGTGHPGGIATIHAGSALGALLRLEQLILEVAVNPPPALIAGAGNVGIHIPRPGRKRRIQSTPRAPRLPGV